jgi:hypothetical protein
MMKLKQAASHDCEQINLHLQLEQF